MLSAGITIHFISFNFSLKVGKEKDDKFHNVYFAITERLLFFQQWEKLMHFSSNTDFLSNTHTLHTIICVWWKMVKKRKRRKNSPAVIQFVFGLVHEAYIMWMDIRRKTIFSHFSVIPFAIFPFFSSSVMHLSIINFICCPANMCKCVDVYAPSLFPTGKLFIL